MVVVGQDLIHQLEGAGRRIERNELKLPGAEVIGE